MKDTFRLVITGEVKIIEYSSKENSDKKLNGRVVFKNHNEIHNENMSILLSRAIGDRPQKSIYYMSFGTGGCTINSDGSYTCLSPNITGSSADLYSEVVGIRSLVDQNYSAPQGNQMSVLHMADTPFSDIEIRCILDIGTNGLTGELLQDNASSFSSSFFPINEIGLKTQAGMLLTHVTFPPVFKTQNKVIEVLYKIRIRSYDLYPYGYYPGYVPPTPPTPVYVTWNPLDATSGSLLSNGNLKFDAQSTSGGVRAEYPQSTGDYYWEITQSTVNSTDSHGIMDMSGNLTSNVNSVQYFLGAADGGQIRVAGNPVTGYTYGGIPSGGLPISVAVSISRLKKIFFRPNYWDGSAIGNTYASAGWNTCASWNGLVTGNPSTNTNGVDVSTFGSINVYAYLQIAAGSTDSLTLIPNGPFLGEIPTGFSALGGTLDPATLQSGLVLSNGNLTVTGTSPSGYNDAYSTRAIGPTDKVYFEVITYNVIDSSHPWSHAGTAIGCSNIGGSNATAVNFYDGKIYVNSSNPASLNNTGLQGFTYGLAIDRTTNQVWFRCVGGNPVTGDGGIDITPILSSGIIAPSAQCTGFVYANFGAQTLTGVVPSGYVNGWAYAGGVVP